MDATVAVTAVRDAGPQTIAIEFEAPAGLDAEPGQFLKLTGVVNGEEYARFYTLSSPGVDDTFEITVGIDPEEAGPFSEFLLELGAGDTIDIAGPFGRSFYEGEPRAVVLAGGPGVGPAVGIGEAAVADGNEVAIVYRTDAPAHQDRLEALRDTGASVVVTDGDIDEHVAAAVGTDAAEQVFVYGFEGFIDDASAALDAAGVDPDDAKAENFG
ncbi:oxidoreductase [Halobellus salinus]|uniref:Oxidoreductase n=1 Tax=Halobellus salinus TaxID=931585 RepID=A0A830E6M2_9EURY|nr:FAD-dependent oxidoreductase [Halobellus salinus]GGI97613.1 oxidoreductase [Halobellus salinus]SMP07275.1 Ferredoxin-NADP reductase [Halobellus salinus]